MMHHTNGSGAAHAGRGMSNSRLGLWWIGGGTVALLILATYALDARQVVFVASISQVHALCSSAIGAFAVALNAKAQDSCGEANALYDFLTWGRALVLIGGIALFVITWRRGRQEDIQPPAPAGGSAWPNVPPGGTAG
jgi:hypothetical protein